MVFVQDGMFLCDQCRRRGWKEVGGIDGGFGVAFLILMILILAINLSYKGSI